MNNEKTKNLRLLKNYKVDCDDAFWRKIKEGLETTPADENLNFTNSNVMKSLMPSPLSENTKQMRHRAENIIDLISSPPQRVIEFGAAYGNLCCEYLNLNPTADYSIVEFEEMLKFTKVFIKENNKNASFYAHDDIDSAVGDYDLFLAWHSVSEMSSEHQQKIFEKFLPRCKYAIIGDMTEQTDLYREVLTEYYGNCQVFGSLPSHHPGQVVFFAERKDSEIEE